PERLEAEVRIVPSRILRVARRLELLHVGRRLLVSRGHLDPQANAASKSRECRNESGDDGDEDERHAGMKVPWRRAKRRYGRKFHDDHQSPWKLHFGSERNLPEP